jgi:hypothetical protein
MRTIVHSSRTAPRVSMLTLRAGYALERSARRDS